MGNWKSGKFRFNYTGKFPGLRNCWLTILEISQSHKFLNNYRLTTGRFVGMTNGVSMIFWLLNVNYWEIGSLRNFCLTILEISWSELLLVNHTGNFTVSETGYFGYLMVNCWEIGSLRNFWLTILGNLLVREVTGGDQTVRNWEQCILKYMRDTFVKRPHKTQSNNIFCFLLVC